MRLLHARSTSTFDAAGDPEAQSLQRFSEVALQRLRLRLPLRGGAATFFPCTFDDTHFAYLPLTVHAALLEYKLRATAPAASVAATLLSPRGRAGGAGGAGRTSGEDRADRADRAEHAKLSKRS